MTEDARIRELMLINLFAVFNERDCPLAAHRGAGDRVTRSTRRRGHPATR
jgi:hypothetical protein